MLNNCHHLEFCEWHAYIEEYLSKSSALYHNLKESSTFGQLSAGL